MLLDGTRRCPVCKTGILHYTISNPSHFWPTINCCAAKEWPDSVNITLEYGVWLEAVFGKRKAQRKTLGLLDII